MTIKANPIIGGDRWMIWYNDTYFCSYVYPPGMKPFVKIRTSLN